jgi:perosamine synthetase
VEENTVIPIAKPMIGPEEKLAVMEVLDSGMLAQGSRVEAFEEAFAEKCGTRYAVATTSGTTALHLALLAHGIGEGHEVITTPFTFIASANSILYTGARPVFVDIDSDKFTLDPELIERAITPATRAIMPVHLFGLCCDMDAIQSIADRHGLAVIEDACQSHGAEFKGKKAGSFGTGAFSFYATKNMTTGEGGMITTNDAVIADQCRVIRQHGMRVRYYHEQLGYNFRMTDIQAAIGLAQTRKLDSFNTARIRNANFLNQNLHGVKTPVVPQDYKHVFHQYTIRVAHGRRDAMLAHLHDCGIGTGVFYPVPVHQQSFYRQAAGETISLPEAEKAASEVCSLPVHPGLGDADLLKIVEAVNEFSVKF